MSSPAAVTIVDLGLGNIRSVARAFERAGVTVRVDPSAQAIRDAERLVVPGQGAFASGAEALDQGGVREALLEAVDRRVPYLGICLGMQLLFEGSDEAPGAAGLGVFRGTVKRFDDDLRDPKTQDRLKVPHMGWSRIQPSPQAHPLLPSAEYFYFVHSYFCVPADPSLTVATATHGAAFCAAVGSGSIFACQFHPEKSHRAGARLIQRFLEGRWR